MISKEWSGKTKTFLSHELDDLSSPRVSFGQTATRADPDAEDFGGGRGSRGSPAVKPVRVRLHLEVLFEVLPLRTQGMGRSTIHLSCSNLIQTDPDCQFWGQGLFWRDNHTTGPVST